MLNKIYMYLKTYHKLKLKSILKMLYQLNGVLESKKNTLILVLYFSATNHLARKTSLWKFYKYWFSINVLNECCAQLNGIFLHWLDLYTITNFKNKDHETFKEIGATKIYKDYLRIFKVYKIVLNVNFIIIKRLS